MEASFVQSEQPPAPKCQGKLLAEWQRLVTTLKRSIYTSLVKYQILKRGKNPKQSLIAFLGVQGQQERVLHAVDNVHDEFWKHSRNRGWASGWFRLGSVGGLVLDLTLSFRISFPLHFWQGHVQFSASAKWKGSTLTSTLGEGQC